VDILAHAILINHYRLSSKHYLVSSTIQWSNSICFLFSRCISRMWRKSHQSEQLQELYCTK